MKSKILKQIVKAALFAALTCVATMLIPIPLPGGGYANAGDVLVIASGFFLGPLYGFFAAAIGSALADILLGAALYAPATFLIKGIMAMIVGFICHKNVKKISAASCIAVVGAAVISECVMVAGYFVYEIFIYSFETAVADIPGNIIQGIAGVVLSAVLINLLSANKQIMKLA